MRARLETEQPANGVFEKWDEQNIQEITDSSAQPVSSSHRQSQQYQGQRSFRGQGIFHNSVFPINLSIFIS